MHKNTIKIHIFVSIKYFYINKKAKLRVSLITFMIVELKLFLFFKLYKLFLPKKI
jgi:hypothetical protein